MRSRTTSRSTRRGSTFPLEYRAEVDRRLGRRAEPAAAHRADRRDRRAHRGLPAAAGGARAAGGWRRSCSLCLPLALAGGVLDGGRDRRPASRSARSPGSSRCLALACARHPLWSTPIPVGSSGTTRRLTAEMVVLRGTRSGLAPILAATWRSRAGLLPIVVVGAEPGLEILRPMALVVLGGLVTTAAADAARRAGAVPAASHRRARTQTSRAGPIRDDARSTATTCEQRRVEERRDRMQLLDGLVLGGAPTKAPAVPTQPASIEPVEGDERRPSHAH